MIFKNQNFMKISRKKGTLKILWTHFGVLYYKQSSEFMIILWLPFWTKNHEMRGTPLIYKNNVMFWLWTTCRRTTYLKPLSFLWCHTGSYICTFTRIIASSYVQCWYDKWHNKWYKMSHIYLLISPNAFIRFTIIFQTYLHIFHADLFECQKVQYN